MSDIFQSDYERLQQLATRFNQQAETNQTLLTLIQSHVGDLESGGWIGEGSNAFYEEMEMDIYPAMERLIGALHASHRATYQIIQVIEQGEEEAAAPFRIDGGGGGTNGSGPGGSSSSHHSGGGGSESYSTNGSDGSDGGSLWDRWGAKGNIFTFDKNDGGKFKPSFGVTYDIVPEDSVWGDPKKDDSWAAVGGKVKAGAKMDFDEGRVFVGAGGEYYTLKGDLDTAYAGDKEWGLTAGVEGKVLSAEGFAGVQWDKNGKRIGAEIGVNLVSVEGSLGANIAGTNVSVTGEIGLKAELGLSVGKKGIDIKLPFISIGLKFGDGVD